MTSVEQVLLSPSERYVHVGSEYAVGRYNQNNFIAQNSDIHFNIPEPIGDNRAQNYVMCIGVHSATIPHTWSNMIHGLNFIYGRLGGNQLDLGEKLFTLPNIHYDGDTLATTMTNLISTEFFGVTVTFDDVSGKFTIRDPTASFYLRYVNNNIYYEIGLRDIWKTDNTIFSSNRQGLDGYYTLECPYIADLSGFHSIYVALVGVSSNDVASYNGLQRSNVIARIPISVGFQQLELFNPNNIAYTTVYDKTLQDLHIQLLDDDGNLLNMNGVDWSMTFHVKFMEVYHTQRV